MLRSKISSRVSLAKALTVSGHLNSRRFTFLSIMKHDLKVGESLFTSHRSNVNSHFLKMQARPFSSDSKNNIEKQKISLAEKNKKVDDQDIDHPKVIIQPFKWSYKSCGIETKSLNDKYQILVKARQQGLLSGYINPIDPLTSTPEGMVTHFDHHSYIVEQLNLLKSELIKLKKYPTLFKIGSDFFDTMSSSTRIDDERDHRKSCIKNYFIQMSDHFMKNQRIDSKVDADTLHRVIILLSNMCYINEVYYENNIQHYRGIAYGEAIEDIKIINDKSVHNDSKKMDVNRNELLKLRELQLDIHKLTDHLDLQKSANSFLASLVRIQNSLNKKRNSTTIMDEMDFRCCIVKLLDSYIELCKNKSLFVSQKSDAIHNRIWIKMVSLLNYYDKALYDPCSSEVKSDSRDLKAEWNKGYSSSYSAPQKAASELKQDSTPSKEWKFDSSNGLFYYRTSKNNTDIYKTEINKWETYVDKIRTVYIPFLRSNSNNNYIAHLAENIAEEIQWRINNRKKIVNNPDLKSIIHMADNTYTNFRNSILKIIPDKKEQEAFDYIIKACHDCFTNEADEELHSKNTFRP